MSAESLPYATPEVAPIPGRIREEIDDFRVEEIPAYDPAGEGDHLFVRFEKRDLTTPEAVRRIARALGVEARDAGWAGLKDRHAVTTQWASFLFADPTQALEMDVPGVRVLSAARHGHKLRTGHLRANRFGLRVRGTPAARIADVERVLARLEVVGMPSYYGPQRFGAAGDNVDRARAWLLRGGRAPKDRFARKLLASALQAHLFNMVLAARLRDGLFERPVPGDLMRKESSGGLFVADDETDAQSRMADWEISPTGPMFGPQMRWPEGEARTREEAVLGLEDVSDAALARFGRAAPGTRRPLRVRPADPRLTPEPDGFLLEFTLPPGAYATVLFREITKA